MPFNFPPDLLEWQEHLAKESTGLPCELGSGCEQQKLGQHAYSGYCSPFCREVYFEAIGAGNFLEVREAMRVDRTAPHP